MFFFAQKKRDVELIQLGTTNLRMWGGDGAAHLADLSLGWSLEVEMDEKWRTTGWWLTYPSEKWWSESQLGWWNSQLNGKIRNVPNHQPDKLWMASLSHPLKKNKTLWVSPTSTLPGQTLSENLTWQWKSLTRRWFFHWKSGFPIVKSDHIPSWAFGLQQNGQGLGIVCY